MNPGAGFYAATRQARRVIVVDPGMLGDTLHLLPAMRELRRNYSGAELHVLCSPVGAELHRMAGHADQLWPLSQERKERRLGEQLRLLLTLRRLRFDASLNFGTNDRNLIYAAVISARRRLGRRLDRWHAWSGLCVPDWVTVHGAGKAVFEERLIMLATAGFPIQQTRFTLRVPEEARIWALANIPDGSVHVSINASTSLKEWPLSHWREMARHIAADLGRPIIATGSNQARERQRLDALASAVPGVRVFAGLSIPLLTATIGRCSLHVGTDSGALHLAVAVGTPSISLFRDYPGWQTWAPQGDAHKVLMAHCECASKRNSACLQGMEAACLAGIATETVMNAVRERLGHF